MIHNVSLNPGLEEFVNQQVASGKYDDPSQVIRVALYLLHQKLFQKKREEEIKAALQQIEDGKAADAEEAFRKIRERER